MSTVRTENAPQSPHSTMMIGQEQPNVSDLVDQMAQVIKLLQEQKVCLSQSIIKSFQR